MSLRSRPRRLVPWLAQVMWQQVLTKRNVRQAQVQALRKLVIVDDTASDYEMDGRFGLLS